MLGGLAYLTPLEVTNPQNGRSVVLHRTGHGRTAARPLCVGRAAARLPGPIAGAPAGVDTQTMRGKTGSGSSATASGCSASPLYVGLAAETVPMSLIIGTRVPRPHRSA
jgi:hypothetical protein